MNLIVGLGNPGEKYKKTRHNVGFMVIDALAQKLQNSKTPSFKTSKKGELKYTWFELKGEKIELIKPQTFMNESGRTVAYAHKKHPELELDDFYVVHDDLDIKLGSYKITKGKGPREHNGLMSIYNILGTKDFWHVRVGVDNRAPDNRTPGEQYVLQDFTNEEKKIVDEVISKITNEIEKLI